MQSIISNIRIKRTSKCTDVYLDESSLLAIINNPEIALMDNTNTLYAGERLCLRGMLSKQQASGSFMYVHVYRTALPIAYIKRLTPN